MAEIDDIVKINRKQAEQIAILQQQVEYLKRQLYGRKSEKGIEHLDLFEEEDSFVFGRFHFQGRGRMKGRLLEETTGVAPPASPVATGTPPTRTSKLSP